MIPVYYCTTRLTFFVSVTIYGKGTIFVDRLDIKPILERFQILYNPLNVLPKWKNKKLL